MKNIILLTGAPHTGKSTAIKKIIDLIGAENLVGFYTEEVRHDGSRTGFLIKTLDGDESELASVYSNSSVRIGRYGVNIDVLNTLCLPCILEGIKVGKTLIIDEIGPMQVLSDSYREILLQISENNYPAIGTVFYASHPWIDQLKAHVNIQIIELSLDNRDQIPSEIIELLSSR